MAVRVGIDLVAVEAVRDAVSEHGEHYLNRIYTEAEIRECRTSQSMIPERLAARFAAKEATIKVLRPSERGDPVAQHRGGAPSLRMGRIGAQRPRRDIGGRPGLGRFRSQRIPRGGTSPRPWWSPTET